MKVLSVESWQPHKQSYSVYIIQPDSSVLLSFLKELFINLDRLGVDLATFTSYFFRFHSKGCFSIQTVKF